MCSNENDSEFRVAEAAIAIGKFKKGDSPVRPSGVWRRCWQRILSLLGCWIAFCPGALAQTARPVALLPPTANFAIPSTAVPNGSALSVEKLTERLHATESANQALADQLERTRRENDRQFKQLLEKFGALSQQVGDPRNDAPAVDPLAARQAAALGAATGASPVPDYTEGMFAPYYPAPGYANEDISGGSRRFPLNASFGPGVRFQTDDDKFSLNIHYESQIEGRIWTQDQSPANSGFFLPRQRFFFNGNIGKTIEYELSINRGLNNINLLNAYLNFHFDDQFEVRVGRFFTPLAYEQYAVSNYWLLTPERSVFTTNLNLNRQIGAMGWGYLFDERLDYALGVFNGSRNSFESLNNSADGVAYLNVRPFQESESFTFLRFLNVGASVAFGNQDQNPAPVTFRIGGGSPDTNIPGPATTPFLILNPDVIERGQRVIGSTHLAYFFKGLSLIGEWQYGHGGYVSATQTSSVRVPYSGFYAAGGYFLTGESIERRTRLKPLRPLIPLYGEPRGIGAWELTGRFSQLVIGEEIFDSGFADPKTWSNSVTTTEVGVNWYWNEYIKFYLFWLRGEFGDPVQYRPGEYQRSADMVWLRCQLYF